MKTYFKQKEARLFLGKRMVWHKPEGNPETQITENDLKIKIDSVKSLGVELTEGSIKVLMAPETKREAALQVLQSLRDRAIVAGRVKQKQYEDFLKVPNQRELFRRAYMPIRIDGPQYIPTLNYSLNEDIKTLKALEFIYLDIDSSRRMNHGVNNTNLPALTQEQINSLLKNDDPHKAADWLGSNDLRIKLINSFMGNQVAVLAGKKSQAQNEMRLFGAREAKTYMSMAPADAVSALQIIARETEVRERRLADRNLEEGLR